MKKYHILIWIVVFLVLGSTKGYSQSTISGQLIDGLNDTPLAFATVTLFSSQDSLPVAGNFSNEDGLYTINADKPGSYYIEANFLGYEKIASAELSVVKNQAINLPPMRLQPNDRMLKEIHVTGEQNTSVSKVDRQVFDSKSFESSEGGTATDVLKNLPSITVNANGEIMARGSGGFVVMINGKPIQTDAAVLLNQLPANAIENIALITAPSAKYDPEGKAGIINITTTKGAADGLYAQINTRIGLPSIEDYSNADYAQRYGSDFTINYRKNKWNFSLGAAYLRNDIAGRREGNVFTIINDTTTRFPSDGERSFDKTNYSGRMSLAFSPDKNNDLSIGLFAGKRSKDRTADILYFDNHAVANNNRIYTFQYFNENLRIRRSDFALGSFDYTHRFDNSSKLTTSFLYEYTLLGGPTTNRNLAWPNTDLVIQDEFNTNDNPLHGLRYQLDYASKPLTIGQIEAGYQFRHLDHTGDFVYERKNNDTGLFELVDEFSSEVNLKRTIHSAYAQLSGNKNAWDYGIGLRIESMERELALKDKSGRLDTTYFYDFIQPFPSANLRYNVNDNFSIKAAYSRRIERTTTFKMNPFPEREHSETLEQGDPELLPEFIDLFELGIVKSFGEQSIYATTYLRNVDNVVNRVNTVFNDTILNRIYSNIGRGRSYGLETGADLYFSKKWKAFVGGNVYRYLIKGAFDQREINSQSWIYSINANTTVKLPEQWSVQWSLNYISARNTAQGEDSRFYNPSLTVKKSFLDQRLVATVQWLNMDLGLLNSNEQAITTFRDGEFFTTTNYVYEVDMIMLNFSYAINKLKSKARFIESEFGEKEF